MSSSHSTAISRDGLAFATLHWQPERTPIGAMLIVHGLGEHSGRWEHVGDFFAARGFEVFTYDLRGHGASDGRKGDLEKWSQHVDDVEDRFAEVRATGLPAILYGHSMGGLIVLDYACSNRPQPDLLVASAPALHGGRPWQRAVVPILAKVAPLMSVPVAITAEQLSSDPRVGEAYFADPLVSTKGSVRFGAEIFAAQERVGRELFRIHIPTLVIHGGGDTVVPPDTSLVLAELPNVERILFSQSRHEPHNDPGRDEILATVAGWLEARLAERPAVGY